MSEQYSQDSQINQYLQEASVQAPIESQAVIASVESIGVPIKDAEELAQSLDTLRSEFGIDEGVFANRKNSLMLAAIADRLTHVEKNAELSHGAKSAELEYIADLVMESVGPHTAYAEHYAANMSSVGLVSDETSKRAHEKYTQPELSQQMAEYMHGPAFTELRKRLGVEDEEPFEVRVLSIDSKTNTQSLGVDPGVDHEDVEYKGNGQAQLKEEETRKQYFEGLVQNGRALHEALGRSDALAPAWIMRYDDGTKYLCIPSLIAEKILYRDEARHSSYSDDARTRDEAAVRHEFTHTQKGLNQVGYTGAGIGLEELRAEHFSGDKHGYVDIKKFFQGMQAITGYSPKHSFEIDGAPYDENAFLEDIARNVGLAGLLDAMTAIPSNYAEDEQANPYVRAIVAHNGGDLSAHFRQMYERVVAEQGPEAVEANVSKFVDKIRETLAGKSTSVESAFVKKGIDSLRDIVIENFRRRYPDESDGYDYK